MKKALLLTPFLFATIFATAQTTKPKHTKEIVAAKTETPDTIIYVIPSDKNINLLYQCLEAGYTGVSSSPHFSKDQADAYKSAIVHLDSLLQPQIKKYHPQPAKAANGKPTN